MEQSLHNKLINWRYGFWNMRFTSKIKLIKNYIKRENRIIDD